MDEALVAELEADAAAFGECFSSDRRARSVGIYRCYDLGESLLIIIGSLPVRPIFDHTRRPPCAPCAHGLLRFRSPAGEAARGSAAGRQADIVDIVVRSVFGLADLAPLSRRLRDVVSAGQKVALVCAATQVSDSGPLAGAFHVMPFLGVDEDRFDHLRHVEALLACPLAGLKNCAGGQACHGVTVPPEEALAYFNGTSAAHILTLNTFAWSSGAVSNCVFQIKSQ